MKSPKNKPAHASQTSVTSLNLIIMKCMVEGDRVLTPKPKEILFFFSQIFHGFPAENSRKNWNENVVRVSNSFMILEPIAK